MRTVALVAFSGVQSLDVSGPLDVFAKANRFLLPDAHLSAASLRADIFRFSANGLAEVGPLQHTD
jgi:hypothetical protein